MSVSDFFLLGGKIAELLHPIKMSYDNNRLRKLEALPLGLYWGILLGDLNEGAWKIDIWAVEPDECARNMEFLENIRRRLTPQARDRILRIKSEFWQHPGYLKKFSGLTIYEAVLDHGVSTAEQFAGYLKERGLMQAL